MTAPSPTDTQLELGQRYLLRPNDSARRSVEVVLAHDANGLHVVLPNGLKVSTTSDGTVCGIGRLTPTELKIEVGKRYRFELTDGQWIEGAVEYHPAGLIFVSDGAAVQQCFVVDGQGIAPGHGRIVEYAVVPAAPAAPPAATTLRPTFGHDPDEFARLQRVFRDGRDLTLGTGR